MKCNALLSVLSIIIILAACDKKNEVPTPLANFNKEVRLSKDRPPLTPVFSKKTGGACGFDKPQTEGEYQFISGWALISDDTLADGFYFGIEISGIERFTPLLDRERRDDVAKYFNNQKLLNSGFSAYIKKSSVPNGSKVTLYQASQGEVYSCNVTASF